MRLWLVPSPGPGAAPTALARPDSGPEPHRLFWLVPSTGPGADRIGSSRHPGPEPYRPQWLITVPLLWARSRVVRVGSSHSQGLEPAAPGRSRYGRTGSSRPPGPEH